MFGGLLAPGGSGRGPSVLQLVGQVKNKNIKREKNIPPPGGPGGGMGWGRVGVLVPLLPHVPVEVVAVERLPVLIDRGTIRPPIVIVHHVIVVRVVRVGVARLLLRLLPLHHLFLMDAAEIPEDAAVEGRIAQGLIPRAVGHLRVVERAERAGAGGGGRGSGGDAHDQMVHRIRWNASG